MWLTSELYLTGRKTKSVLSSQGRGVLRIGTFITALHYNYQLVNGRINLSPNDENSQIYEPIFLTLSRKFLVLP